MTATLLILITLLIIINISLFVWYRQKIKDANVSVDEYYNNWQETEKEIRKIYKQILSKEEIKEDYVFTFEEEK